MPLSTDTLNCQGSGFVNNLSLGPSSLLAAANVRARVPLGSAQVSGTVATGEARIFSALASGLLHQVNISLDTVNTSSDTVVIDLQKSTGGGAYATVLSSTYTMNSSKTARTVYNPSISTTSFSANDIFKVVWTVTGTSAAGLLVTVHGDASPS
jgi:hypothetical protein